MGVNIRNEQFIRDHVSCILIRNALHEFLIIVIKIAFVPVKLAKSSWPIKPTQSFTCKLLALLLKVLVI